MHTDVMQEHTVTTTQRPRRFERITVTIDVDTAGRLVLLSGKTGISVSALTRHALTRFLDNPVLSVPAVHDNGKHTAPEQNAEKVSA